MRLKNPSYAPANPVPAAVLTKLQAVLAAAPLVNQSEVTFDDIRAQLTPAQALIATDGVLSEACKQLNIVALPD